MLDKKRKREMILLRLIVFVLWLVGCSAPVENSFIRTPSMLAPQSPVSARIAGLSWFMIILGTLIYIGVMVYFFSAARGNRAYNFEEQLRNPNRGNGIVMTWGVGFTAMVLVVLFGLNLSTMRANHQVFNREEGLVIDVIGRQWWWEVQYAQQGFETANEIHIPVGQPVALRLVTKDVIHSLWIPELSGKLDLLPNQVNELVVLADQTGEYWGECAEFCGTQHAKMQLRANANSTPGWSTSKRSLSRRRTSWPSRGARSSWALPVSIAMQSKGQMPPGIWVRT
jgi:cytochrome c oxidase subunit 2